MYLSTGDETLKVKLLYDGAKCPTRSFKAAGYDLYAPKDISCPPQQITKVPIGIATAIPPHHSALFWDRSGMGAKGIHVFGGVVDEDYRGEWCVLLYNSRLDSYEIKAGDRVAQFLIQAVEDFPVVEVDTLDDTERGEGAFSSTGR